MAAAVSAAAPIAPLCREMVAHAETPAAVVLYHSFTLSRPSRCLAVFNSTTSAETLSDTRRAAPAITPQIRPSTPYPTPPALHGAHVRQSRPVSPPPRRPPASAMTRRQSPSYLHPRDRSHHRRIVEEARSTLG